MARQVEGRQRLLLLHTVRWRVHRAVRHADVRRHPDLLAKPGGDQPFITCGSDPTTNRWDASAEVELPSGLRSRSLRRDGKRADLEARGIHREPGEARPARQWRVSRPCRVRAVSQSATAQDPGQRRRQLPRNSNIVAVDGGFTYTDETATSPWSLLLDGSVKVGKLPIGNGTLGINGRSQIDFSLEAGIDVLDGTASLSAKVFGWIDAPRNQFVVSGSGRGCLGGACAAASGELSSTGVAGCVTVGTSTPTYDLIIPLDGSAPHLDTTTYSLTAGFGYVWGASTADLLGGSCDFSAYEPTRAAADQATRSECAASPADRSRHGCRFPAHPRDPWAARRLSSTDRTA